MDVVYVMTALVPAILLVSMVLTAAGSVLLLWLYRRATLRGMGQAAGAAAAAPQARRSGKTRAAQPPRLAIQDLEAEMLSDPAAEAQQAYRRTARSLWSALAVYSAGGLACALVISISWMVAARVTFRPSLFLYLWVCFAWPCLIAVGFMAAMDRRRSLGLSGAYFALLGLLALLVLIFRPAATLGELVTLWLLYNLPGSLLLLAFLRRGVRAVGPLVLAFMLSIVSGAFIAFELMRTSDAFQGGMAVLGVWFGLRPMIMIVLLILLGLAVFGLPGWGFLVLIGGGYRAKRFSEQSLTLDAMWLLFALAQSFTLVNEGWGWIFSGPLAFAAYKLVSWAGFAFLRRRCEAGLRPPMLLLLRVFSLGSRSERFFDAFSRWWRRSGSVSLISGPDLVADMVEPHEFLDFVSGRLSREFVQDEADLQRRLARLDREPDPDGLYRVNDFFCHADTWQMTMGCLAEQSEAVLMDLRSFSSQNQGCLYELGRLLDTVDLERVVFLVDDSTDRPFLEERLQRLWSEVADGSPNRRVEAPAARFFHAKGPSGRSIKALLLTLFEQPASVSGARAASG
jgi:hypothetical protein